FSNALKKLANINYEKEAVEEGAVLNGIAWDAAGGRMFVTGKRWPKLLEIRMH
ncbi:MAG: glutaminyl-peptide cyclotransferase, partial [Terrimonas sp.]|nr:glutaminyl-peptide cyclotransferase [Terrimonas sp.]